MKKVFFIFAACLPLLAQETGRIRLIPPPTSPSGIAGKHVDIGFPNAAGTPIWDGVSSTVSWGPAGGSNSFTASAATPLIAYPHFSDDDTTRIVISYSFADGMNFKTVNKNGSIRCDECRDPSLIYDAASLQWLIIASPSSLGDTGKPQVWKSVDFETWTGPTLLNVPGLVSGANAVYAPEFFRDPPSGKLYILMPISTNGGTSFVPHAVEYNAATDGMTDHTFTISGSAQNKTYDYYLFYDARTGAANPYVLTLVDQYTPTVCDPVVNGRCFYEGVQYATSSSLVGGTFTMSSNTPTNSSSLWTGVGAHPGYFGFGVRAEAPSVMVKPGTSGSTECLWLYADVWDDLFNTGASGGNRRHYRVQRAESCGGAPFSTVTTPASGATEINVGIAEHGTLLPITDPGLAGQVLTSASKHAMDNGLYGRVVLGDATFPGYYTATVRSKGAHGFIQSDEAAELAFESADHHSATIAGCGDTDQYSCPPPVGGLGRLLFQTQAMGGNGMFQMNNTNVQTGETSIFMCDGCGAFGSIPISDLPESQWTFGMNNQYFGPIPSGGNAANNWFYWYSRALGHGTNLVANSGFESGDFSSWGAGAGTAILNYSSSPAYVHSGIHSAVMASDNTYIFQTITGLTAGKLYRFTGYIRGDAGGGTPEWIAAQNSDGTGRVTTDMGFVPGTSWTLLGLSITPTSTSISISVNRGVGSFQVYADDFTINSGATIGAFPLGISPYNGEVRSNYGFTIGGGDDTSLLQTDYANIDTVGLPAGFVNIGSGPLGNHNAYVRSGSFEVGNNTGDALFFGTIGTEQVSVDSFGVGLLEIGNGTPGSHNAYVRLGSIGIGNANGDALFFGPTATPYINMDSAVANTLNCGDGVVGRTNCIFNAGVVNVASVLRNGGVDLTSGLGSATTWIKPVLTTGQVQGGTVVATAQSYADQFVGRDAQLGSFTLNNTGSDTGIGNAVAFQSGTSYVGGALSLGNNFNPTAPYANINSPSSGVVHLNTGTSTDRNAIVAGGYFDALNLFSVSGVNGVSKSLNCSTTTTSVRNAAGTGTVSLTYVSSCPGGTVTGGILTN